VVTEVDLYKKDLVGNLRGIFLLCAVWSLPTLEFPLESLVKKALRAMIKEVQQILQIVSELTGLDNPGDRNELAGVVNDVLEVPDGFYDVEYVTNMFSMFAGGKGLKFFTFSEPAMFMKQSGPILSRLLGELVHSLLAVRTGTLEQSPEKPLLPLGPGLLSLLCILRPFVPTEVTSSEPPIWAKYLLSNWLQSESVRYALAHVGEEDSARNVIREASTTVEQWTTEG
jgi:hypothetical protein